MCYAASLAEHDDAAVRLRKSLCELKLGRYEAAAADAAACVALQPENWKGWDIVSMQNFSHRRQLLGTLSPATALPPCQQRRSVPWLWMNLD